MTRSMPPDEISVAAERAGLSPMSEWYAESGGDTSVCEICEAPLDDAEPWKRGLDGAGAHLSCLRAMGIRP